MGGDDEREGRAARSPGQVHVPRRRQRPEHGRRGLHVADQPRQGRPAGRHVLVAAQHPGVDGRRAQPDALRRARRRRAGDLRARLQVPVLRPAGDGRQAGRRVGRLGAEPAGGRAPQDGRLPDARRPVRDPGARGHPCEVRGGGHPDRAEEHLSRRHEQLRLDRQRGEGRRTPTWSSMARRSPTASSFVRAHEEGRLHAEDVLPDQRAVVRRPVHQGRRARTRPRACSTP